MYIYFLPGRIIQGPNATSKTLIILHFYLDIKSGFALSFSRKNTPNQRNLFLLWSFHVVSPPELVDCIVFWTLIVHKTKIYVVSLGVFKQQKIIAIAVQLVLGSRHWNLKPKPTALIRCNYVREDNIVSCWSITSLMIGILQTKLAYYCMWRWCINPFNL